MTVRELIAELSKHPDDAKVYLFDDGEIIEATVVGFEHMPYLSGTPDDKLFVS
jgi:hypothetical protein